MISTIMVQGGEMLGQVAQESTEVALGTWILLAVSYLTLTTVVFRYANSPGAVGMWTLSSFIMVLVILGIIGIQTMFLAFIILILVVGITGVVSR